MTYRKIAGFTSGRTDLPILQRDALIDAGTVGLFDFAHGWGFPRMASPVAAGENLVNYVRGGAVAANGPVERPWAITSGISVNGGSGSTKVNLPASWQFPANMSRMAVGFFAKISTSNINNAGNAQVIGCRSASGNQWGLFLNYANNAYTGVAVLTFNGSAFNMTGVIPTDGLVHHYVPEFIATGTQYSVRLWIDGVLVYSSAAQSYGGSIVQPGAVPAIGYFYNNASSTVAAGFSISRIWLQDLSAVGSKTLAAMIAQDRAENAARFS